MLWAALVGCAGVVGGLAAAFGYRVGVREGTRREQRAAALRRLTGKAPRWQFRTRDGVHETHIWALAPDEHQYVCSFARGDREPEVCWLCVEDGGEAPKELQAELTRRYNIWRSLQVTGATVADEL